MSSPATVGLGMYPPPSSPHMVGAYSASPQHGQQPRTPPRQSGTPQQSPQRLQLHNPNTTPNSNSFVLRPTHTRGGPSPSYTSNSIPPPQPQFTPVNSSPLRPRNDNVSHGFGQTKAGAFLFGHNRANSAPPDEYVGVKGSDSLLHTGKWGSHANKDRPSKSADFMRKLGRGAGSGSNSDTSQKSSTYQPLSDEDDDPDERLRLPTNHRSSPRSVSGAATTLGTSDEPWTNSAEILASEFPRPPRDQYPVPNLLTRPHSVETFTTAQQMSSAESIEPPVRLPPHPAEASPRKKERPRSDFFDIRASRNNALFAAETGGMIANADGEYIVGKGPGEEYGGPQKKRTSQQRPHTIAQTYNEYPPIPQGPKRLTQGSLSDRSEPSSRNSGPDFTKARTPEPSPRPTHRRRHSDGETLVALARQGTLFHPASSQERAAKELGVMLGKPRTRRLSAHQLLPAPETPTKDKVRLEASKKSRARVELGVVIERECIVEGGEMRGRLEIVVRGGKRGKGLRVGGGKLRVLGFEETDDGKTRHIFYQQQFPIREFVDLQAAARTALFADAPDEEGFRLAREGTHEIPFAMPLPIGGGAKGTYTSPTGKGPNVRYVVVGSVKLHIPTTGKRAIAHFYRPIVVLPYHNPASALAPAQNPIVAHATSGLGWQIGGEKGKVEMQVALGRRNWVAGQRVWCEVAVRNQSRKKINRCTLAVLQSVNTFGLPPKNAKDSAQGMSGPIDVARTKIAEETVEADFMDSGHGHITSKSWWTGLEPGESNRWDMSVPIPTGMISIARSRFVEVTYILRVTLNGAVYVDVPLRLINFLSIDPPPMPSDTRRYQRMPVPVHAQAAVVSPIQIPETQMRLSVDEPMSSVASTSVTSIPRQSPASTTPTAAPVAQGYTTEQLNADDGMSPARSSSTTLQIDTLLAQSQVRARASEPQIGQQQATEDLIPRAESPDSVYSTLRSNQSTLRGRGAMSLSESVDDEERDRFSAEAARRDGRGQLAYVSNADREVLLTDDEGDDDDYPRRARSEESFPLRDDDADISSSEGSFEDAESVSDADRTPLASPRIEPVQLFDIPITKHPRDDFLAHISEEEEPMDDDMLTEIVSNGNGGGGHFKIQCEDDEDDDMMEDQEAGDATPKMSHAEIQGRRSLEDRLAGICGASSKSPGSFMTESTLSPYTPNGDVDYAEPIDIDQISLTGLSLSDQGHEHDTYSERTFGAPGSPYQRPQTVMSYATASWSDKAPTLPSPGTARDIRWGGALTGRTVSGRSAMLNFDDDNFFSGQRWKDQSNKSPLSFDQSNGPGLRDLDRMEELDDLEPPRLGRVQTASSADGSYVTANGNSDGSEHSGSEHSGSQHMDVPALGNGQSDSESAEGLESPRKPVYTLPLPAAPAGEPKRNSLIVPDRFRPPQSQQRVVSETESHDSFTSSTSTNVTDCTVRTTDSVLPAVKARVAQIETRREALRKFSVASSAGLHASPAKSEQSLAPASPVMTGRVSPSGRRTYTTALGIPRPRSAASMHSLSSDTGTMHENIFESPHSGHSGPFSLDEQPTPRAAEDPPRLGLDAAALGGSAFARSMTSPTSSLGHARWDMSMSDLTMNQLRPTSYSSTEDTEAATIERAAAATSVLGPRGPRARQPASTSPAAQDTATLPKALLPPTARASTVPAPTPMVFTNVKSERASVILDDDDSSDTYSDDHAAVTPLSLAPHIQHAQLVKTLSNNSGQYSDADGELASPNSISGGSDWSTGWKGISVRLPQLRAGLSNLTDRSK